MRNVRSVILPLSGPLKKKELWIRGIEPRSHSYEVRVFADYPEARSDAPTVGNPHFIGSIYGYGFGSELDRGEGRIEFTADGDGLQRPSLFDAPLSLAALEQLYSALPASVRLYFVTLSTDEKELPDGLFHYRELVAE